jgi:hypothetical protein
VTKSSLFGIGIAFSPLHIGVVTLLLLGKSPLQRALTYVAGWATANALAIAVLMAIGEAFSINLSHGGREQVLIDLLGAGALIGLGLYQLTPQANIGEEGMALKLMNQLPDFSTAALLGIGAISALLTPENLVFYLKEAGLLLLNEPGLKADAEVIYERTRRSRSRPILQCENPLERIRTLLTERTPLYRECAHLSIDVGGLSKREIASGIIDSARYHFSQPVTG